MPHQLDLLRVPNAVLVRIRRSLREIFPLKSQQTTEEIFL